MRAPIGDKIVGKKIETKGASHIAGDIQLHSARARTSADHGKVENLITSVGAKKARADHQTSDIHAVSVRARKKTGVRWACDIQNITDASAQAVPDRSVYHKKDGGSSRRKRGSRTAGDIHLDAAPALALDDIINALQQTAYIYNQHSNARTRVENHIRSIKHMSVRLRLEETDKKFLKLSHNAQWTEIKKHAVDEPLSPEFMYLEDNERHAAELKKANGKRLEKFAEMLPVAKWVKTVRGFGMINLAKIIAETGNLSNYAGPQKLRKRMGLMPGQRRIKVAGGDPLAKEKTAAAIGLGLCPRRRAVMHVLGDGLIKLNDGKYRQVYDARKVYEVAKAKERGVTVLPWADVAKQSKKGEVNRKFMTDGHVHKRSMRVMEQVVLNDLWERWTDIHGVRAG